MQTQAEPMFYILHTPYFLTLMHYVNLSWDFIPVCGIYRIAAEAPCLDGVPHSASGKHYLYEAGITLPLVELGQCKGKKWMALGISGGGGKEMGRRAWSESYKRLLQQAADLSLPMLKDLHIGRKTAQMYGDNAEK